jgi:hypothetical protein
MTALLDADFLVYRACYSKDAEFLQMIESVDWCIESILRNTEASDYRIFLTGPTNFRKQISEDYKATRKKDKPPFYYEVRDYLINNWKAEVSVDCESDDLCGLYQTDDTVTVGEDKDLLTIPGLHYRIAKKWSDNKLISVSKEQACYNFYVQCLTGDPIDCIKGLRNPEKLHHKKPPAISEEVAAKYLEDKSPEEMKQIVQGLYQTVYGDSWFSFYDTTCRLLYLRRKDAEEYYQVY